MDQIYNQNLYLEYNISDQQYTRTMKNIREEQQTAIAMTNYLRNWLLSHNNI